VAVLGLASTAGAITPNDPVWAQSWGEQQVGMATAWDITKGDPSVVIGIVDTGSLTTVPDLQGQLVPGWDFITNSAAMQDTGGHGTLSATIAVGKGNDGQGVAGYCWRCKVMPVRVASSGSGFDSGLAALGIRWAVDHGARIISIGWSDEGTYTVPEPRIASAIAYAAQHNVLVLASAGNTGATGPTHPAADPGAYAVAGTDPNGALYSWSTYGSWVTLAAPGCQWGYWGGDASNPYGLMNACGSSTSAPALAGIAGLMLSVNPSLTPSQIVGALQSTAAPVAGIAGGRIDAYRALIAVGGKPPPPPPPPPAPPPPVKVQKPKPKPTGKTTPGMRVQKGWLRMHWHLRIKVRKGKVAATLRSPKAMSCTVSIKSSDDLWFADGRNRRKVITLSARVPAGRYGVDVWCKVRKPRRSALQLRAFFS
jgi:hypothetical protein